MFRILKQSLRIGVITEAPPAIDAEELTRLGMTVRRHIEARFGRSLAIRQVDAGSCNGCELEIHALNNPYYDIARFGIHFVASPRHADVLLVTGPVSRNMENALRRTVAATPTPRYVIAAGTCAHVLCELWRRGERGACRCQDPGLPADAREPPARLAQRNGTRDEG